MADNSTFHNADVYDRQIRQTIPHYDDIHNEILNFIKVQHPGPADWLDTGCGTGTFVRKAQERFPATRFWVADPSEGMLAQARRTVSGLPCTVLGQCGTADLPEVTDRKFDVITAIQCHHYLSKDERLAALRACHTLLNNDGFFLVSENIRPSTEEGIRCSLKYWGAFQQEAGKTEQDVRA
ncbi:MAG: class I SAM-dependent methyltransferase, partial [Methanomicrobiales archaeon]|nr:class I SAM-dependent methyltransferase [Methanomicrobiales archaeon]